MNTSLATARLGLRIDREYFISGVKEHPAFNRDDDSIDEVIGIKLLFDLLEMFPDSAFTDPFRRRNLFGDFSHRAASQHSRLALCEQRAWMRTLACLDQQRNNGVESLDIGSATFCGRHRHSKYEKAIWARKAAAQRILRTCLLHPHQQFSIELLLQTLGRIAPKERSVSPKPFLKDGTCPQVTGGKAPTEQISGITLIEDKADGRA
jgi:hypothetical protein